MIYPELPGPPPVRHTFGALHPADALACHPFVPSKEMTVPDLRAFYVSGQRGAPLPYAEVWLQIEAGLALGEPLRVTAAGDGLPEVISGLVPTSVQHGHATRTLCYIPPLTKMADGQPLITEDADDTYQALARLIETDPSLLHPLAEGDLSETIVLTAAMRLARDDPAYFLLPTSLRQGNSGAYKKANHDARGTDGLPVEIKTNFGDDYDERVLKVSLSQIINKLTGWKDIEQPPHLRTHRLAGLLVREALHNEDQGSLDMLSNSLKKLIDTHRAQYPMPASLHAAIPSRPIGY